MTSLTGLLRLPVVDGAVHAMGWTLLHFVWQGAILAVVLWCALALMDQRRSQARYAAGCAALLAMTVAPLVTFAMLVPEQYRLALLRRSAAMMVGAGISIEVGPQAAASPWQVGWVASLDHWMPWLLLAWTAGVVVFGVRLNLGLLLTRRMMRMGTDGIAADLYTQFEDLRARLGIARAVRLVQSAMVHVPTVIGWLKPVVLVPAGCFAGMSPSQVEAVLAHELAHIRRHDYLVSVFQSVMEALLFYHPAVWWVSKQVRRERECCCDEMAVSVGGDRLAYARALHTLEERRATYPELAFGANGGALKMRIRRLLKCSECSGASQVASAALLTMLMLVGGATIVRFAYGESGRANTAQSSTAVAAASQELTADARQAQQDGAAAAQDLRNQLEQVRDGLQILDHIGPDVQKQLEDARRQMEDAADQLRALQRKQGGLSPDEEKELDEAQQQSDEVRKDKAEKLQELQGRLSEADKQRMADAQRHLQEQMEKMKAVLNSEAFKKRMADAAAAAQRMNTPEFHKQMEDAISEAQRSHNAELHSQLEEAQAAIARMNTAEVRKQLEQAQTAMAKMNSEEFRRQMDAAMKVNEKNLAAQQKIQAMLNSPEFKKQIADAQETAKKINTPEFRRQMEESVRAAQANAAEAQRQMNLWANSELPPAPPAEEPANQSSNLQRVSSGTMASLAISQPPPSYPAEAKARHIQGTVVLKAIISKEGTVENLFVVSGPPELTMSAMDAVRQWKYKPYLLNGQPTEVETTINVHYTLAEPPAPGDGGHSSIGASPDEGDVARIIGGSVSAPRLIYQVVPEYSDEAKTTKTQGIVLVHMVVDAQGFPDDVHVIRSLGHGLDEKAVEAVQQYRFKPAMEYGRPVPAQLNVEVNFRFF